MYLVSLPNPGHEGNPKFLRSDNPTLIERWIQAENRPGFGVYYLPNPLKPGATIHSRENIAGIIAIYVDVDFKDILEAADDAVSRLGDLLLQPTLLVNSGHGCHVLWQLKEAIACDDPDFENVCSLQAALIDYLGADPQVRPWSLLRQPGTLNSKRDPHVPCEVIRHGPIVDISEVRELVELVDGARLLTRKPRPATAPSSERYEDERKPPVDVEARLAAMKPGGPGETSIHATQLSVTASLLRGGVALEEATRIVLDATRAAVADDPTWNWRTEELRILHMGCDFIVKKPELVTLLPDAWREPFETALAQGRRPDVGLNSRFYLRSCKPKVSAKADRRKGAAAETRSGRKYRFPLIAFDDMRPGTEPNYLVDELFPAAGLALVYGAPKSGKSFWVFDAVMHVALGWEYRDRAVQQGPVIYCAFEGAHGYRKRSEAFRRHHCLTDERPPLFIVPGRADLIKDHASLIGDMQGQLADVGVTQPPKAVVLDTLNKSLTGSESKDVDMANYIAAAEAIQKAFGCLVIIVHHHGIEESRPRGHTSLRGAVDAQIKITRDEQNNIIAEIEDMRDGPEGAQIASRLVVVEVGADLTGKHITSAAVEPMDTPEATQRMPRLTPNQRTMLSLLEEVGPSGLSVNAWNSKARAAGLGKHRPATLADLRAELRRKGLVIEREDTWLVANSRNRDL